jgi:hypothetical protein
MMRSREDVRSPGNSTSNDEQMGSTTFGDVEMAGVTVVASLRQIETDRGIAGRVSGCV